MGARLDALSIRAGVLMLRLFMRLVFGGRSNKREASLFAFLVSVGWGTFVLIKTAQGVDMSAAFGMVTTVVTITFTGLAGTTTLHHMRRPTDGADDLGLPDIGGPSP
jgi:hypothetical protein